MRGCCSRRRERAVYMRRCAWSPSYSFTVSGADFDRSPRGRSSSSSGQSLRWSCGEAPPAARPSVTMSATAAVSTRAGLGSASAEEAAYTLDGGYALEPNSDGTGGWLAHRASLDLPSSGPGDDWLPRDMIEAARDFRPAGAKLAHAPRVLVLYGSLRESSFSRRLAHECARLLEAMGADVRVFSPQGLPVRDPSLEDHPKVKELRALSLWSEAHVWVSPEMHGTLTGVFKNQIDWLPLNTGSPHVPHVPHVPHAQDRPSLTRVALERTEELAV